MQQITKSVIIRIIFTRTIILKETLSSKLNHSTKYWHQSQYKFVKNYERFSFDVNLEIYLLL